ncbi:hypothetical protein EIP91_011918 [Steccherinum ochraceum]|uniref:Uncharacterized protein n=1 Tax=Steccherinum ochraceum TaxID=92696 RepID=A0A4R0RH46_9APHY|nr:hypothetical protein EIP91_011918 [Steccherinum ochraceum]
MPPSNPFSPVNETSSQIWVDEVTIDGASIAFVAYGVHITLCFLCLNLLWAERKNKARNAYAWMVYILTLFVLGSVGNGMNMYLNQSAFVNNRNYPGGPGQYEIDEYSLAYNVVGTAAYMMNTWCQDGLLLYRFYIIVCSAWWMMIVPICIFIVSIVMSLLLLSLLAQPGSTLWESSSVNFALAYWSTSIATTITLTTLIVGHLLYMRLKVRGSIGTPYLSVSAMLIESAFLYSAFALAFLIPYAQNSSVNYLLFQVLGQVQSIAPLLIILRVAQGRALSRETWRDTINASKPMHFRNHAHLDTLTSSVTVPTPALPKIDHSKTMVIDTFNPNSSSNSTELIVFSSRK